jgi:hypothetical protein
MGAEHDEVLGELREVRKDITELKTQMARLEVKINGGPGSTPFCLEHAKRVERVETMVDSLRRDRWIGYGIFTVVVFLVTMFGTSIKKHLGIP